MVGERERGPLFGFCQMGSVGVWAAYGRFRVTDKDTGGPGANTGCRLSASRFF